jgi:hypothetical protein
MLLSNCPPREQQRVNDVVNVNKRNVVLAGARMSEFAPEYPKRYGQKW